MAEALLSVVGSDCKTEYTFVAEAEAFSRTILSAGFKAT